MKKGKKTHQNLSTVGSSLDLNVSSQGVKKACMYFFDEVARDARSTCMFPFDHLAEFANFAYRFLKVSLTA